MDHNKGLKKIIKTRELTKSEKTLIGLLGSLLIIFVAYRFVYIPQTDRLAELEEQKITYQDKITEINETLRKEKQINEDWDQLNREKDEVVARYFPKLDQAQIIYLLNSLVEDENVNVDDLNFNRPSYEEIGDFEVKNMAITLPYEGQYEGIIDVINRIKDSPRKIHVDNMSMDVANDGNLHGSMSLKVYSLDGIAEADDNIIYIDVAEGKKNSPFANIPSDGGGDTGEIIDIEIPEVKPYVEETLIDFETRNAYFVPSHDRVRGDVTLSTKSKSKKNSLRMEYYILASEEENKAYIDVSRSDVVLRYPPNTIGMWVYAYNYSPATVGISFLGQMGETIDIPFTQGIGWTGWKYLEIAPPLNVEIYPLRIDKLFVDIPQDRDDFGVLLMDKLEAVYTRNIDEDGYDISLSTEYIFHIVAPGETVASISKQYYGNISFVDEILKLNEMKATDTLSIGKVLILKKR